MTGNGVNARPPSAPNGGEFLLSLLQKPHNYFHNQTQQPETTPSSSQQHQQQQPLVHDPAVAAVGPSLHIIPSSPWPSNGPDLPSHHLWSTQSLSPPCPTTNGGLLGLSQNPFPLPRNQFQPGNQIDNDLRRLGFATGFNNASINGLVEQTPQLEHKLKFGSFPIGISRSEGFSNANTKPLDTPRFDNGIIDRNHMPNSKMSRQGNFDSFDRERRGGVDKQYRRTTPPPGFSYKPRGGDNWDFGNQRNSLSNNADREMGDYGALMSSGGASSDNVRAQRDGALRLGLSAQLDRHVPPSGSNLLSVSVSDIEEHMMSLKSGFGRSRHEVEGTSENIDESSNVEVESDAKNKSKKHKNSRDKDSRSDTRGQRLLSQRERIFKRQMQCRSDIDRLNAPFLAIFQSLIPPEEEKAKQQQLLGLLERLVTKEWPEARLYLYGSCANSFGVSKSDIDLCLAIEDMELNKSDVLLKLADILQSDNLQNVQALTRARVPIVKLMDPVTGISCDICINNILAVVNTKLLRDYARIDVRLQQLAFIVKHWAKSRGVNVTYQGTLSSYAYVLMCIHFLQMRRPAILPCLQRMKATYSVTVDNIQCAYFDQVEQLRDFGFHNKETIAHLVSGFFNYWAYCHDYADSVISVRTGSIISKRDKDWTRRIGNDRHLICIEDPFETSHDLGRVVDKYSIRVLREEFERAAEIMQYDPNPCAKLFEPYVPG